MNNFYLAKQSIKWAGYLNIFSFFCGSILIFLIFVYHFLILINSNSDYSLLKDNKSSSSTNTVSESYSSYYISEKGYAALFSHPILTGSFFSIKFGYLILPLFLAVVIMFIMYFFLGLFSLIFFIKAKNMFLIHASVAAIFLPLIGGFIALNFYNCTKSNISPHFIAPYSLLRKKIALFGSNLNGNEKEKKEKNIYA